MLTHHCLILLILVEVYYQLTLVMSLHVLVGATPAGEIREKGGIVILCLKGVCEVNRLSIPVSRRNDFVARIKVLRLGVSVMRRDGLLLG